MPVGSLLVMRHAARPVRDEYTPGEKVAPYLGSSSRPPKGVLRNLVLRAVSPAFGGDPAVLEEMRPKMGEAMFSSFAEELSKVAYVPNTQGDQAGVLRSLLVSLLSQRRLLPANTPTAEQVMEQRLLYGGDQGRLNYAQAAQAQMAHQLLADSKLQAALHAIRDPSQRVLS